MGASESPAGTAAIDHLKAQMRASWMAGDFGVVARMISGGAERFVERLDFEHGSRVLDVATGTGNLAIPLARRGALVTGLDIAPNLLLQARQRAAAEGLSIRFDEGDAEAMPYEYAAFDVVVSMFGAMFAPRPYVVASEMARVLRPGGLLAMANWNPESFTGEMFRVSSRHVPPGAGGAPPVLWGDASTVRERLEPYFERIDTSRVGLRFDLPMNAADTVDFFRTYFGPTQVAFNRLDQAGQKAMAGDLERLWAGANVADDPARRTLIENEYLQITAFRKTG